MKAVAECKDPEAKRILEIFCHLYAVHLINSGKDWYLEQGYISPSMSKDIRDKVGIKRDILYSLMFLSRMGNTNKGGFESVIRNCNIKSP